MRACTHRTSANGAASRRTSLEFVALGSSTDDPKIPTSVLREHAIHQGIIRNVLMVRLKINVEHSTAMHPQSG